ncbi:MAG: hypothetical protein ACYCT9_04605 [Leptospirillum sp.]
MKRLTMLFAILFLSVLPQISSAESFSDPSDNALIHSALRESDSNWVEDILTRYKSLFLVGISKKKDIMDTFSHTPKFNTQYTFPNSSVKADMLSYQTKRFFTTYQVNFFFYSGTKNLCGYAFFNGNNWAGGLKHDELVKSCGTQSKQ